MTFPKKKQNITHSISTKKSAKNNTMPIHFMDIISQVQETNSVFELNLTPQPNHNRKINSPLNCLLTTIFLLTP